MDFSEEEIARQLEEHHEVFRREFETRRRLYRTLSAGVLAVSALALVTFVAGYLPGQRYPGLETQLLRDTQDLKERIGVIDKVLSQTAAELQRLKELPPSEPSVLQATIKELEGRYDDLGKRIAVIDDSLGESAEKALSVPLLRKDVAAIKDVHERHIAQSKESIDRVYDQNKWFIGLMLTGLITLAVSNLLQSRPPKEAKTVESKRDESK